MRDGFKKIFSVQNAVIFCVVFMVVCIIAPVLLEYGYVRAAIPETLVGTEGLAQLRTYLIRFCTMSVFRILLDLATLIWCIAFLVEAVKSHRSILHMLLAPIVFMTMLGVTEPQRSFVDVQGERFSGIPTVHAFRLLYAVEKDMDAEPIELSGSMTLLAEQLDYSYTPIGTRTSGRRRLTEYALETEGKAVIAQLSASDYSQIKPFVGEYTTHKVLCWPNSGLLYAIDDGEPSQTNAEAEAEYYAGLFTLTYEEDGYLRWTPEGYSLSLVVEVDGEQTMQWNADGKSEYKPLFYEGHENVAYLEQVIHGKGYVRVSNIITVTEPFVQETTEYVLPEFTGSITYNTDGTVRCTLQPYGLSIDLPEGLAPVFLWEEITETSSGAECNLFRSMAGHLAFKMWWEHSPFLASTEWGLEDIGKHLEKQYEGSYYVLEPLEGLGEAYYMIVRPGQSDLERYYQYVIVKVGEDEYIWLRISYTNASRYTEVHEILDTIRLE